MNKPPAPHWTMTPAGTFFTALLAGLALLTLSTLANADPPSRAARIGYMVGNISFSPSGEDDWFQGSLNRPLTSGDRLWSEDRARAEIQMGPATVRMGGDTSLTLLNLDDDIIQLQLNQGTLHVRVRRLDARQVFEIDTPNLAFVIRQPGEYRVEVDQDGNGTTLVVRKGRGEAYGDGASYVINSNQPYRFSGTDLRDYDYLEPRRLDEFDRWAVERDRRYDRSTSARFVSADVVGFEDLDSNGEWRNEPNFGNVWYPRVGSSGWAPYRDGHWSWIDPWGWTWVDDQPWGYAVSHYGRWTYLRNRWAWVPGPRTSRAYYAPALVAFIGGDNFQLTLSTGNVGGIGWFPLAPREVYRPSYAVSRGYYENINRSNTTINTTVINNTYNQTNITNVVYVNRDVPGAVVAVPTTVFVQSQPVSRAAVRLAREQVAAAPIAAIPRVAPTERSVRGPAAKRDNPPGKAFERRAVARATPPPQRAAFADQQKQLATQPGRPLDETARKALRPAKDKSGPAVTVVPPTVTAPAVVPPRINRTDRKNDRERPDNKGQDRAEERKAIGKGLEGTMPVTPGRSAEQPPTTKPPQDRGRGQPSDKPGKRDNPGRGKDGQNEVPFLPPRDVTPEPPPPVRGPQATPAPRQAEPAPVTQPNPMQPPRAEPRRNQPERVQPPRAAPPGEARPAPEQRERRNERPAPEQRERRNDNPPPAAVPAPSKEIQPAPPKAAPAVQPVPAVEPPSKEVKPQPQQDKGRGKDKKKDDDDDEEKRKGKK